MLFLQILGSPATDILLMDWPAPLAAMPEHCDWHWFPHVCSQHYVCWVRTGSSHYYTRSSLLFPRRIIYLHFFYTLLYNNNTIIISLLHFRGRPVRHLVVTGWETMRPVHPARAGEHQASSTSPAPIYRGITSVKQVRPTTDFFSI